MTFSGIVSGFVSILIHAFGVGKGQNSLDFVSKLVYNIKAVSRCDGMADVTDSKSVGSDTVSVRVRPPAP